MYHFDVHNAFQSTPDPGDSEGKRTWLKVTPEWLTYIKEKRPSWWPAIEKLLETHSASDLAVEMFAFVQGRTDASRRWSELVEDVIIRELKLVPNRADPCVYSGHVKVRKGTAPCSLGRATDDFILACKDKETYDVIVAMFEVHWTVHHLDVIKEFFGLRFVCTNDCVSIDQTGKVHKLLDMVLGDDWHDKPPDMSSSTPMKAGMKESEAMARATPYTAMELEEAEKETYKFGYRTVLCSAMHIGIWTRLDILPACVFLAQYQTKPSAIHFSALLRLIGFLRLKPDVAVTFRRNVPPPGIPRNVGSIRIEIVQGDPTVTEALGSDSYHVMSVDLPKTMRRSVTPVTPREFTGIRIGKAPFTEGQVDANLPGGVFEHLAQTGGSIEMGGTTVIPICKKQDTMAENTTESEIGAAHLMVKFIKWLDLYMCDIGLPFDCPIPIAEDNSATRLIAHAGQLTRNVRHVAIKTLSLQHAVRNHLLLFRQVKTDDNRADHFTKALPLIAFRQHTDYMIGLRFITSQHASAVARRNNETFGSRGGGMWQSTKTVHFSHDADSINHE